MTYETPQLIMAPIQGITDAVYRQAFSECFGGFDRAIAPFIQPRQGKTLRSGELRQLSPENNSRLRTIPQLLANHAETFLAALKELHALGFDEVNWNLGCPYPTVAGRGRGAGLLPHPARIDSILNKVISASPVKLSVKMRLGHEDPDEFIHVLEVLNRHPISEVVLHPRTAGQMYDGKADLERASQAMSICRHPFIFNGDITTVESFVALQKRFANVAGWMIGRGALSSPFLPSMLKGAAMLEGKTRREQLCKFHEVLYEGNCKWQSGQRHLMDKMTAQWEYLSRSFSDPRGILKRIRSSSSLEEYHEAAAWSLGQELSTII